MLYAYLHFFGGISAPHTSARDQGTDWRNSDPQVEPFVEIHQGDRQDYEMPGAPRANTSGQIVRVNPTVQQLRLHTSVPFCRQLHDGADRSQGPARVSARQAKGLRHRHPAAIFEKI